MKVHGIKRVFAAAAALAAIFTAGCGSDSAQSESTESTLEENAQSTIEASVQSTIEESTPEESAQTDESAETYTSDRTGAVFALPAQGYANMLVDDAEATLPAIYKYHEPTNDWHFDRNIIISLDGKEKRPNVSIIFYKITGDTWQKGAVFTIEDFGTSDENVALTGVYNYRIEELDRDSETVATHLNADYFDDVELRVLDVDDGDGVTLYFYVSTHDDTQSHEYEGVMSAALSKKTAR